MVSCGVVILILCPNCMRFFVGIYSVYAPKRRDLAATIKKRLCCPHCGYVFGTSEKPSRMSKDEWLEVISNPLNMEFLKRLGRNPLDVLRAVSELKERGFSDGRIIALI